MNPSTPTLDRTDAIRLELHDLDRRTLTARSATDRALLTSRDLRATAELTRTRAVRAQERARRRLRAHHDRLAPAWTAERPGTRAPVVPLRIAARAGVDVAPELPYDAAA